MTRPNIKLKYDSRLNWLLLVPIITAVAGWFAATVGGNPLTYVVQFAAVIAIVYLYVAQIQFIKQNGEPKKNKFKLQYLIMLVAFIVPFLGILAGDYFGAKAFGTPAGYSGDFTFGLGLGLSLALACMYICAIGNALYIRKRGGSKALSITGKVFYVLGYLLIAGVTWIAYGIMYSLHDPSTE